ncbi:hypothetical protein Terro_2430 [Terriglobus roseus DSM 18391]|uniref:Carboxypeptidase regulatory-like domain-containing protein n=2 Tax=Terriglobus roseus TaxID=392734 RepID=I3ZGH4_TERRK|nr:hypothetical protein Terro_2063 [Terriglobus roseus DSM 18391]AFL88684.1 hypothetical protein Terro_2430 [Terriglobus roseus DSM 18391]
MRMLLNSSGNSLALRSCLALAGAILIFGRFAAAQGAPLAGPAPFKAIVSVRGGGVERNAPYRVPQRVVQGVVRDGHEKGIPRAEVFLKDDRTLKVRQLLADENGNYIFGGLPLDHDYQVWAKAGEITTPVKPVSSFMGMHDVTMNFHIAADSHTSEAPKTIETAKQ